MNQTKDTNRILWLDILRVASALAIVFIHTASYIMGGLKYGGVNWFAADIYIAAARYAVPVFVMISGIFFLSPAKNITIKSIYTKYIFRILTVLIGWALIRTLVVDAWLGGVPAAKLAASFWVSVKMYWFLPMIIGLYIITPVFRAITAQNNKKLLEYFMLISFVFALCLPVAQAVWPTALLADFITLIKLPMLIFGAHFVFGYYVYNYGVSKNVKYVLYVLAALSLLFMAWGTYAYYNEQNSRVFYYAMHGSAVSPFAFLLGAGVFVLCKDVFENFKPGAAFISYTHKLAYCSLGIYMLHIIIVEAAARFGLFKILNFCSVITIALASAAIFLLSGLIISLMYKVNPLKKYLL
ncbi:surface polysaccharide O-acyltransferase-like enzyme [Elusimicrobium simillimum]|uniref:acyltransferase n=1 Tax=Elusimicrobium simillimum TaxID=3143438 RepID=UPI003C6EF8FF